MPTPVFDHPSPRRGRLPQAMKSDFESWWFFYEDPDKPCMSHVGMDKDNHCILMRRYSHGDLSHWTVEKRFFLIKRNVMASCLTLALIELAKYTASPSATPAATKTSMNTTSSWNKNTMSLSNGPRNGNGRRLRRLLVGCIKTLKARSRCSATSSANAPLSTSPALSSARFPDSFSHVEIISYFCNLK